VPFFVFNVIEFQTIILTAIAQCFSIPQKLFCCIEKIMYFCKSKDNDIMRRPNITEAIKKGLAELPLDIEVWLYGSEARGDARPDSDIDLLVIFNKTRVSIDDKDKIYDVTYPIELDTGVSIQPFIVSKSQWESRMTPFRDNVQTDRIRL